MTFPKISSHGGHSGDLCDHARDAKPAIIEAYLSHGFTHLAVADHLPPHRDKYLYADEIARGHDARFLTRRFDHYFTHTRPQLQQIYGDKLHLLFGFETEYYGKNIASRLADAIEKYRPDLIVASVHHVDDIPIDFTREHYREAIHTHAGLDSLYETYYDHQLHLFTILTPNVPRIPIVAGHLDLVKTFSPDHQPSAVAWAKITRNVAYAVENSYIFEVNSRAFKKGLSEPSPGPRILAEIHRLGGEITLGDDSHGVGDVGIFYPETVEFIAGLFEYVVAFEWEGDTLRKVKLPLPG